MSRIEKHYRIASLLQDLALNLMLRLASEEAMEKHEVEERLDLIRKDLQSMEDF